MKRLPFIRRISLPSQIAIDLVLLQLSIFFALAATATYHLERDAGIDSRVLIGSLRQYYVWLSIIVCPLFIGILTLNGIYAKSVLNLSLVQRAKHLASAIAMALLMALATDFLFLRTHIVARSVAIAFSLFVLLAFVAERCLQRRIQQRYDLVERNVSGVHSVDAPILVVGGAGYIGSMLCRCLLSAGERVRVLDSLVYGAGAVEELRANPRFELMEGDCRHIQSVVEAIKGVKSVVHLAAIVGDPACEQDRQSALEINYAATRMLIEICKGHGVERFVFASSCSVYGASEDLMDEESAVLPISLYGQTKVDSETSLLEARSETFHPVILRLATVFGAGYRPRFDLLVNLLSARAVRDGVITIYNEQQWRPFIHVWDVARGFAQALNAPLAEVSGEVFNLGDDRLNYMLSDVGHEIRRAFPSTEVRYIANEDRRTYRVSFEKILTRIGYQCTVSLGEGIDELKKALEGGWVADYTDPAYNNQKFLAKAGHTVISNETDRGIMAAFSQRPKAA